MPKNRPYEISRDVVRPVQGMMLQDSLIVLNIELQPFCEAVSSFVLSDILESEFNGGMILAT